MKNYLFTSESVSEGHPDKMADQISDAILDAMLKQDPYARVACETMVTTGMAVIAGEVATSAQVDIASVVRETIKHIGYDNADKGLDYKSCAVLNALGKQSPDIAMGVDATAGEREQGAGDQGLMFGYASDESDDYMPLTISLSHRLVKQLSILRKSGQLSWLRPDSKSQVTAEYRDGKIARIESLVISTQHDPDVTQEQIREAVIEEVFKKVVPTQWFDKNTKIHVNPTGRFVLGGPQGDCGLTGRKIIVDTYGGHGAHGGGAFSGKDPSKVDRSAAYAARHIAKNIVAAGFAQKCLVQVAYAIGVAEPVGIMVNDFGTSKVNNDKLLAAVKKIWSLKPADIIRQFDLLKPRYFPTAAYGHFGRSEESFTWEKLDKVEALKSSL